MKHKVTCTLFILMIFSFVAGAQTADEIITRYISFIGGAKKWKKIKTITSSGTYNYGGVEFPFQSFQKSPDLYHYIVTFKGKSFEQAYDGHTGWRIDRFKNEKEKTILNDKQAMAMANESDVALESPFINYKTKGYKAIADGKDTVNGKLCYKIKLTAKNADSVTYFFDTDNYSLVKKKAIAKNAELNGAMLDIFYSDYKNVGGITTPFKTICLADGQTVLTITVQEIKLNEPIEDSSFKP